MIQDIIGKYNIILASQSPRRRELVGGLGISFTIAEDYPVEESYPHDIPAQDVAAYISKVKSEAYNKQLSENDILITADTIVTVNNKILGKPKDRNEAISMLRLLSGNRHVVVTGVTFRNKVKSHTFSTFTNVYFKELSDREIEYYIDNYKPFDKAGSYGIQEWIGYVAIEKIEGSFYNVMGLPVHQMIINLEHFIEFNRNNH